MNSPIQYQLVHYGTLDLMKLLKMHSSKLTINLLKHSFFSKKKCIKNQIKGKMLSAYRMDRNIIAEVLPVYISNYMSLQLIYILIDNMVILRMQYQCYGQENQKFINEYKFDIIPKGERQLWICKEESSHDFNDYNISFVQGIMPICVDDQIKLAFSYLTSQHFIDIKSIKFLPPIIKPIPPIPYKINEEIAKKVDKNRICELEELDYGWFPYEYYLNESDIQNSFKLNKIDLDIFKPQLKLMEQLATGSGILAIKALFKAEQLGIVKNSKNMLGVEVEVVKNETINEIKKQGLYFDLENLIQLRIGDILIFYLTKSKP